MLLAVAGVAGLGWTGAGAQMFPENHYLVYEVPETFTLTGPIVLDDQFVIFTTDIVEFDKFANPVEKNSEPYFDPMVHQTWWLIDDPQTDERLVGIDNQFGRQDWYVGDGRYLVLPAHKDMGGWPTFWNHYKCYDAIGPAVNMPVQLHDQFNFYTMTATDPVLFCNPCLKEAMGQIFHIIHPEVHLAVYRLEPPMPGGFIALASDQFGERQVTLEEPIWLVVPTMKLTVVGTEQSTWGAVKSLYSN
jgi:hypothetical protein